MTKIALVAFFDAYPPKSGAGNVTWDFYESIKGKEKKFFQLSDKSITNKKIVNQNIYINKPVFKLLFLQIFFFKIFRFLNKNEKKILIIEGASWVFYSFLLVFFSKFITNLYVVYRSHNIEYDLRSFKNLFFIKIITKYFENYIFNRCNLSTVVSKIDQKRIKKLYEAKSHIFPNSIDIKKFNLIKKNKTLSLPKKYIFFCGSYDYLPNKLAIDYLLKEIFPLIKKKKIHLVLAGGFNDNFSDNFFLNFGIVNYNDLKILYKKSIALVAPIKYGFGTKLKVIEAMCLGTNIITTKKGIEGIDTSRIMNLKITSKKKRS